MRRTIRHLLPHASGWWFSFDDNSRDFCEKAKTHKQPAGRKFPEEPQGDFFLFELAKRSPTHFVCIPAMFWLILFP
jgi:hypothetical protein